MWKIYRKKWKKMERMLVDELKATFGSIVKNTLLSNDIEDKDIVGVIGVDFTEEEISDLMGSGGSIKRQRESFLDYQIKYNVSILNQCVSGLNIWTYCITIVDTNESSSYLLYGDNLDSMKKMKGMRLLDEMINENRFNRLGDILG